MVYKEYPSMTKLLQRQSHEFSSPQSMDIEHLSRYMSQELTSLIASTEKEPITFRRQACYGGVIYIILSTCIVQYVCQYHVLQVRKILS